MMMKRTLAVCAVMGAMCYMAPAFGAINNGFDTDSIYTLYTVGTTTRLAVLNESDGNIVTTNFHTGSTQYVFRALTFASAGSNDARLFLYAAANASIPVLPGPPIVYKTGSRKLWVREIDSSGATVKTVEILTLGDFTDASMQVVGLGMRYTRSRPTSLFIGANVGISGIAKAAVYEVDLDLTTIKNFYTGAMVPDTTTVGTPPTTIPWYGSLNLALDDRDGAAYVSCQRIGSTYDALGRGNVLRIDTRADSTRDSPSVYTTAIDAFAWKYQYEPTENPGLWNRPRYLAYRQQNPGTNPDDKPTLLVGFLGVYNEPSDILEFYLDSSNNHPLDTDGNLEWRDRGVDNFEGSSWQQLGQMDEVSGATWVACSYTATIDHGHLNVLYADDTQAEFTLPMGTPWANIKFFDVDSPPYVEDGPPEIAPVLQTVVDANVPYVERMFVTSGATPTTPASWSLVWSLVTGPGGAAIDPSTGRISGWTPTTSDTGVTFSVMASNTSGSDIETWIVSAVALAPDIRPIEPDPDTSARPDIEYLKQLRLSQGSLPVTWSVLQGAGAYIDESGGFKSGWTPGAGDAGVTQIFSVQATNSFGSDIITWTAKVGASLPVIGEVTPDPDAAIAGLTYQKRLDLVLEGIGNPQPASTPVVWSVLAGPAGLTVTPIAGTDTRSAMVSWSVGSGEVGNSYTIEIKASNEALPGGGYDTESWVVQVMPLVPFNSDYVYALRMWANNGSADDGAIEVYQESDGTLVGTINLFTGEKGWTSLTFAGDGTADARLFLSKLVAASQDIQVAEITSGGVVINNKLLKGDGVISTLGNTLDHKIIRYSQVWSDSLFVGATSDASGTLRGMVWEFNLALTTLKNTYTGAVMPGSVSCQFSLDEEDGSIYMVGRALGRTSVTNWYGDVIKIVAGSSTSSFTTLIDGATLNATVPGWYRPWSIAYRSFNPKDGTPTLLFSFDAQFATPMKVWEFALNTTNFPVAYNSLAWIGSPAEAKIPHSGQEDVVTGTVWWGVRYGGVLGLGDGDTVYEYSSSDRMYYDADSPKGIMSGAPVIAEVLPDPDVKVYAGGMYVQKLALTAGEPTITWSVAAQPTTGAVVNSKGLVTGWTPGVGDIGNTFSFTIQASNGVGSDTESWDVVVGGTAPVIQTITSPENFVVGPTYIRQMGQTTVGLPAPTWSLVTTAPGAVINPYTGYVSGWTPGVPDLNKTFQFTVKASNASGSDQISWTVQINPIVPGIQDITSDYALEQAEYVRHVYLTQGTTPIVWTVLTGPTGAAIDGNGVVSGWTPTHANVGSTFTFIVQASNTGAYTGGGVAQETWDVVVTEQKFNPDYLYVVNLLVVPHPLTVLQESDGAIVTTNLLASYTGTENFPDSITFAGVGPMDARLFGAKFRNKPTTPAYYRGVRLTEINGDGVIINSRWLDELISLGTNTSTTGGVGGDITLRWSSYYPQSLFLAGTKYDTGQAMVWELDLGLTTVKKTFSGPTSADKQWSGLAIDDRDGDMFFLTRSLQQTTDDGKGDMIKIDYSAGTYTTVIDGDALSDSVWLEPYGVMIQSKNSDAIANHEPTVLVSQAGVSTPYNIPEFYVDRIDGNGHLERRTATWNVNLVHQGQEDEVTDILWTGDRNSVYLYGKKADDTKIDITLPVASVYIEDIDSPNLHIFNCNTPKSDADNDGDVDVDDFARFQLCITTGYGLSGTATPALSDACSCFDYNTDGEVDDDDLPTFVGCASGPGVPASPTCD